MVFYNTCSHTFAFQSYALPFLLLLHLCTYNDIPDGANCVISSYYCHNGCKFRFFYSAFFLFESNTALQYIFIILFSMQNDLETVIHHCAGWSSSSLYKLIYHISSIYIYFQESRQDYIYVHVHEAIIISICLIPGKPIPRKCFPHQIVCFRFLHCNVEIKSFLISKCIMSVFSTKTFCFENFELKCIANKSNNQMLHFKSKLKGRQFLSWSLSQLILRQLFALVFLCRIFFQTLYYTSANKSKSVCTQNK